MRASADLVKVARERGRTPGAGGACRVTANLEWKPLRIMRLAANSQAEAAGFFRFSDGARACWQLAKRPAPTTGDEHSRIVAAAPALGSSCDLPFRYGVGVLAALLRLLLLEAPEPGSAPAPRSCEAPSTHRSGSLCEPHRGFQRPADSALLHRHFRPRPSGRADADPSTNSSGRWKRDLSPPVAGSAYTMKLVGRMCVGNRVFPPDSASAAIGSRQLVRNAR